MNPLIESQLKRFLFLVVFFFFGQIAFGQISASEFLALNDPSISFDSVAKSTVSVVKENGKLGLMNALGEWIASPVYDEIGNINQGTNMNYRGLEWYSGIVKVKKLGKYGAINCQGQEVIPCKYKDFGNPKSGVIHLEDFNGKRVVVDKQGKTIADKASYTNGIRKAFFGNNNNENNYGLQKYTYALINKKGDTLLKMKNATYTFDILGNSEGMTAFVLYPNSSGGLGKTHGTVGFLGPDGKIAVPPVYSAKYLSGGMGMSAWIYEPAFHSGRALVFRGDSTIYIDKTGKEVLDFKDKPGKVNSFNDFNENGFAEIYYWGQENGKRISYYEIIDTTGKVVLQTTNGYIGNDGIDYTTISKSKYFYLVENEGKTLYNDKLEKQFHVPRSDENYKYSYYSFPDEILSCVFRKNKTTGTTDYTFIDRKGEQVCGYIPADRYYDPVTGDTILKNGNGLIMKNKSGEVVYSCDSCGFTEFHMLSTANNRYTPNISGVFQIGKGKEMLLVNYKGTVISRFPWDNNKIIYFQNISEEYKKYKTTPVDPDIKIAINQAELNKVRENMPWKDQRY